MKIDTYYDLHRHYGACLDVDFVLQALLDNGQNVDYDYVKSRLTFTDNDILNFPTFLSKFTILDEIPWTLELLNQSIINVCDGLHKENIDYCWLNFSVNKYVKYLSLSKAELIEHIYDKFEEYAPDKVGLVLSLKYETLSQDYDLEYLDILTSTLVDKLIGIDLVGDEKRLDKDLCIKVLRPWVRLGKMVRMHVAESCGVENARFAIKEAGVTNVAHGIKILEDPKLINDAIRKGIVFDVAITSNYITGVLPDHIEHPVLDMINAGLLVTINSDDPVQLDCTIQSEFQKAKLQGLSDKQLFDCWNLSKYNSDKFR